MSGQPNCHTPSNDRPADLCTSCELFGDDPDPLYELVLLLTTSHQTAEQRFVAAEDYIPSTAGHRSIQTSRVGGVS